MMTKIEKRSDGKFALMSKDPFTGEWAHVSAWPTQADAEASQALWMTGYISKKAELDAMRVESETRARKRDEHE